MIQKIIFSKALIIQKPATDMHQQNKHELKKVDESSNMTFFMEQEEDDIYATLDDRDSITSENINSFNKTVYIRNDEVKLLKLLPKKISVIN